MLPPISSGGQSQAFKKGQLPLVSVAKKKSNASQHQPKAPVDDKSKMDGPMSISSLLGEREAPPLSLAQCTVQLPGPSTEERNQYLAEQLARFQALEKWEEARAAESMGAKAASYGSKWAQKADVAAAQAFPDLEARAVSRVIRGEKPAKPAAKPLVAQNNKRKNETPESTQKTKVPKKEKIIPPPKKMGQPEKQYKNAFEGIWRDIAKKEIPKVYKLYQATISTKQTNDKKTAVLASKEARKWQYRTTKHVKAMQARARRAMREMMQYWKKSEKEGRVLRKAAEKEKQEAAKREDEERENARQARKLNFLITQTELYSHFVSKVGDQEADVGEDGNQGKIKELDFGSDEGLADAASHNAQRAVKQARERAAEFGEEVRKVDIDSNEINFQNPTSLGDMEITQPKLLDCTLKEYQIKGLNWLANLYEQGINGILADEMGLGKTVQSISVMAYLAEVHNIWGPFVVVAPASTLHNWHAEIKKFVPQFKVLPYWGNSQDRTILRRFWDRKQLRYTKDSEFHVLVTSYQLIVADAQYFNRIKWQYMILDEAQAIKSSQSSRWKALLALQCRNRLLLTGTPIQNSMQELWALLHFIMPTLFDSHEEFSDWFSKDIESHATKNSQLNEQQLKRLHMILKPFMLRRVKKNVQKELGDKIEIDILCPLNKRQRKMYQNLQSQISLSDLEGEDSANLMNLVMQFRKVCNHPDLFERADFRSPLSLGTFGSSSSHLSRSTQVECSYTLRNLISLRIPKMMYRESLDVPSEGSDVFIQKKIERMLTVWDPQSETIRAASKLSGTPAGRIVELARKGLFERALDAYELGKSPTKFDIEVDPYFKSMERAYEEPATAPPISIIGADRSLELDQQRAQFPPERLALFPLTLNEEWQCLKRGGSFPPSGLYPDNGRIGYSKMTTPSMRKFIMESGKLARLDKLLAELQANGHRVLIYFQMTKMMDLMEEYLTYKKYKFQRLDGASNMTVRRDTVDDWQTTPDLFVFLLSTRAGGLGINLTAADTVIFYDSDWNPTIDSQAMDRAHRLGQTKQVTVYRLLVKGTIEQRMRDRAKQKEHVQQVVMEGGKAADFKNPGSKEVASWLLDDAPIGESNEGE